MKIVANSRLTCNSSSQSVRSISGAGIVMVISLLHAMATLDVRSGPKVGFVASVDTRSILQSLLHLGLGARTTSEVSVATNGRKIGSASSEIVVRQRGEAATGVIPSSTIASGKARHVLVTCRVE